MIKRNTIFDFLTQVMVIWGISVLSLCLFSSLFGEAAKEYSSIFQLGNAGISITTLLQFFFLALIITSLNFLFLTDILIKNLSIMFRTILMFLGVIVSVGVFAAVFLWFPVNQVKPWILFFICFFICFFISVMVSVSKEKRDNKKMQEALERLKEGEV